MTLPPGRSSLVSEEETPETCSLANSIGPCINDQSPMVRVFEFFNIVLDSNFIHLMNEFQIYFPVCKTFICQYIFREVLIFNVLHSLLKAAKL